jgi:hypothetical protein
MNTASQWKWRRPQAVEVVHVKAHLGREECRLSLEASTEILLGGDQGLGGRGQSPLH